MAPTPLANPGTNGTASAEGHTPLSARRLRALEYHGFAAGAVAVGAVIAAWATVVAWAPELYRWPFAADGFRSWIVFGGLTLLFYLLACAVGSNVFASVRRTAGGLLTAHQPISGLVTVTAVLCTVPRWPDLATAWTHNTPDPLAAHWGLWLAAIAPAVLAGLVGHAAAEYTEWTGFRLASAQRDEAAPQGSKPALRTVIPDPRRNAEQEGHA